MFCLVETTKFVKMSVEYFNVFAMKTILVAIVASFVSISIRFLEFKQLTWRTKKIKTFNYWMTCICTTRKKNSECKVLNENSLFSFA